MEKREKKNLTVAAKPTINFERNTEEEVCPTCNSETERDALMVQELVGNLNYFEQLLVLGEVMSRPKGRFSNRRR